MQASRRLVLKREAIVELTAAELRDVVGGATVANVCGTRITVLVSGCPSDPRICEYETQAC